MANQNSEKRSTLIENFEDYFSVILAHEPESKAQSYHVRYRVYCEEFGYESKESCPNEQETDEFDERSLHCLIMHKRLEMPAGCVRLVPAGPELDELLPFEKNCAGSLDKEFIDNLKLDRRTVCEISRLAVDGAFRRRARESSTRFGKIESLDVSQAEARTFSLIAISGFLAATALTVLSERTNVFAMMEPFLPRLLQRSGIYFERAGKDVDYHGIRAPYFIKTQSALDNMCPDLRYLYDWIYEQIREKF